MTKLRSATGHFVQAPWCVKECIGERVATIPRLISRHKIRYLYVWPLHVVPSIVEANSILSSMRSSLDSNHVFTPPAPPGVLVSAPVPGDHEISYGIQNNLETSLTSFLWNPGSGGITASSDITGDSWPTRTWGVHNGIKSRYFDPHQYVAYAEKGWVFVSDGSVCKAKFPRRGHSWNYNPFPELEFWTSGPYSESYDSRLDEYQLLLHRYRRQDPVEPSWWDTFQHPYIADLTNPHWFTLKPTALAIETLQSDWDSLIDIGFENSEYMFMFPEGPCS